MNRTFIFVLLLFIVSGTAACQTLPPATPASATVTVAATSTVPVAATAGDMAVVPSNTVRSERPTPVPWEQSSWIHGSGFGTVTGAGVNGYDQSGGITVLEDGTLTLSRFNTATETLNQDLNNDGYTDIVIANSGNYEFIESPFAQIRKENGDHDMPDAQIYWGGPQGYDDTRTTGIPGERPSSLAAIDFNLDGRLDLALAGGGEFHPPYVNSRVYYATADGFNVEQYVSLPTFASTGTAVGDLNKDGYPDVIFADLGDYTFPFPPSMIYWGGPEGFAPERNTPLETEGVGGLAIVDINADGWLDILFGNSAGFPPIDQLLDYGQDYDWPDSYIYLGGPEGYTTDRRIGLETKGATGVKVADFNQDGHIDIVFANAGSFALPPLPDSYIYWGSDAGFTPQRRTSLTTNGASAVSVSDLNDDGWLDLVLGVTGTYLYIGKPEFPPSYVYWGSADGFSDEQRLALPTEASQGVTITDVNDDGVLDILFSQLGDFNPPYRPVLIYYGDPTAEEFYSPDRTATLPGKISYGSIVVGAPDGGDYMSHGNRGIARYDRPNAYVQEGVLVSSMQVDVRMPWTVLHYSADIPQGASLSVVLQSSADKVRWQDDSTVVLQDGSHTADITISTSDARPYVRYKAVLTSDGDAAPILKTIRFE